MINNPVKQGLNYSIDKSIGQIPEGVSGPYHWKGVTYESERSEDSLKVNLRGTHWENEQWKVDIDIRGDLKSPQDQVIYFSHDIANCEPDTFSVARRRITSPGLGKVAIYLWRTARVLGDTSRDAGTLDT